MRLQARWLFPGDGPPIPDAVITISGDRIAAVERGQNTAAIQLGNAAIIPGLINAHTHLEFSDLAEPIEPRREFATWIQNIIAERRGRAVDTAHSVSLGQQESLRTGTTALAEIATSDWIFDNSLRSPQRCLFYREFLGLSAENVAAQLQTARHFLQRAADAGVNNVGLSPHAPYSLHPDLFEGLCSLAKEFRVPVAMHLAESPAELELLSHATGPLVDLFTNMRLWRPGVIPPGTRPLHYLQRLAQLPQALVVHGNFLDGEEIKFLAAHPQLSIVYCPRTHAAMQSGEHPWRRMQQLGIAVLVGTDSRASNPDLSLWNELRLLSSLAPDLPASDLLAMATSLPADTLGWNDLGTLAPGNRADLCVVSLTDSGLADPQQSLFNGKITQVMCGGEWQT
ncbi:amidohydrolase family protein [Planctomicrobium piriforme]|nr:amidohydrolase family protein [Planctomicrobium piriforme]